MCVGINQLIVGYLNECEFVKQRQLIYNFVFVGQNKKAGGEGGNREAEEAEQLLLTNKSLTDLTTILTQLVGVIVGM